MGTAIAVKRRFGAADLRKRACASQDTDQARRLLALAAVLDGQSRGAAARIGGMDRQTLRDWVHAYNAKGPNGLINATSPGRPPKLTKAQKEKLRPIIVAGPDPVKDGVVRWRCVDLKRVIKERFGIDLGEISVGRLLKELGFSYVSARPQHPEQSPKAIEIWFQDEARVGQKNGLVYQWDERGSRPRQARDQRYENAYIFGAICPARDVGAALILPRADGWAMQQHLDEISRHVVTGAHAVVLLDQAGWHTTDKLMEPTNITMLPLPPKSPELNAQENIWQYLRQNFLSNRVFASYEAILDACQHAWCSLTAEAGRIASIGTRDWAIMRQSF